MEVQGVFDENAAALGGGKASVSGARSFGTPAAKLASAPGAELSRRALGDISNKAGGALTGPGKQSAATPRRALGDITNGGAAQCSAAAQLKAAAAGLPISERTAAFITEDVVALARVYAAEGTEALAGLSGREQQAQARREEEQQAQAYLEQLSGRWCDQEVRVERREVHGHPPDSDMATSLQQLPVEEESTGVLDFGGIDEHFSCAPEVDMSGTKQQSKAASPPCTWLTRSQARWTTGRWTWRLRWRM